MALSLRAHNVLHCSLSLLFVCVCVHRMYGVHQHMAQSFYACVCCLVYNVADEHQVLLHAKYERELHELPHLML